jgi:hypothetical protein
MIEIINLVWGVCIYILQVLGGSPGEFGLGYMIANLLIFVVIQPALIIIFFALWRAEKKKNNRAQ